MTSSSLQSENQQAMPRIVSAAIRLRRGLVICGPRHFDSTMRKVIDQLRLSIKGAEQGFVDQFGSFYNREEAYEVARNADQRHHDGGSLYTGVHALYSEDLY